MAAVSTTSFQIHTKPALTALVPKLPTSALDMAQTASEVRSTWTSFKQGLDKTLRERIRDTFFLPIPLTLTPAQQTFFAREQDFFESFFDTSKPLDPNFPGQQRIRESFTVSDQKISVRGRDGLSLSLSCRVLESKQPNSDKVYNLAIVAGNLTTSKNNIVSTYPYLDAFLAQTKNQGVSGRFIIISQYDTEQVSQDAVTFPYKPATMDEAGYLLTQALSALRSEYGEIDQVVAHSLGCMVIGAAFKYLIENPEANPRHILLDRGPSSVKELARAYYGGSLLHPLADKVGWSIDLKEELVVYCAQLPEGKEEPTIIVSGVVNDHYFSGAANLCLSSEIQVLRTTDKVAILYFHPHTQVLHDRAHHSMHAGTLHAGYLVPPSNPDYLDRNETLADRVVRGSLEKVVDLTFVKSA